MARIRMTDRTVQALRAPTRGQMDYFDERTPGFGLRVTASGHRSWIALYRHEGRVRRYTLGSYPTLRLADARAKAKEALSRATLGEDPAAEKKIAREADTFADLAREYMERHAKVRKRERTWRQDQRVIDRELLPRWRHRKAKDIRRRDIQALLDDTVKRGAPIQANSNFALVRKMFNFAVQREIVDISPCMGIGRPTRPRQGDRALSSDEIRKLWEVLESQPKHVAHASRLQLLTAQRGGEILSMRWEDVDFTTGWWTIPAARAKNGRSHRVPLSPQALSILNERREEDPDLHWVFPSTRGVGPVTTFMKDVCAMRIALEFHFNPHDLRRTAASHMTAMGIPRLTVSKILNHVETGVTAVYDRYSYDGEKRHALVSWATALGEMLKADYEKSSDSHQEPIRLEDDTSAAMLH
jgi:integrase